MAAGRIRSSGPVQHRRRAMARRRVRTGDRRDSDTRCSTDWRRPRLPPVVGTPVVHGRAGRNRRRAVGGREPTISVSWRAPLRSGVNSTTPNRRSPDSTNRQDLGPKTVTPTPAHRYRVWCMTEIAYIVGREILDSRGNPTVEVEVVLEAGAMGRRPCPRRLHRRARGGRAARRRRPLPGQGCADRGRERQRRDRRRARSGSTPSTSVLDRPRCCSSSTAPTTRPSSAPTRSSASRWPSPRRPPPMLELPLYRYLGGANAPRAARADDEHPQRRRARRQQRRPPGVHDHAGRGGDRSARRCAGAPRSTTRSRRCCRTRGCRTAVGDEGGFAPDLGSNEEALAAADRGDRAAGLHARATTSRSRSTSPSTEFYARRRVPPRRRGPERSSPTRWSPTAPSWVDRYPIVSIEDGMAEDDWDGWEALTDALGDRVPARRRRPVRHQHRAARATGIDAARQLDPRQGQPDRHADRDARGGRAGHPARATRRSCRTARGETEDTTIADLAVATNCGQIKTGAPARSDRVAKYNQLLRIEDELGEAAEFRGRSALAPR